MRENDGWRFAGEKAEQAADRLRPGYCGKRKADHPGNFCQVRRRPLPPLRAPGPAGQYWQRCGDHDRHRDLRNVLERSSARETTLRVALGNIAQQFLRQLDIDLVAYVAQVGPVEADSEKPLDVSEIRQKIFQNDMHVIDQDKVEDLHQLISETKEKGDTLGGIILLVATGQLRQLGHEIGRQACRGRCRGQCHGQFGHDEPAFAGNFGRQLLCQSIDRGCFFKQAADEAGQPALG